MNSFSDLTLVDPSLTSIVHLASRSGEMPYRSFNPPLTFKLLFHVWRVQGGYAPTEIFPGVSPMSIGGQRGHQCAVSTVAPFCCSLAGSGNATHRTGRIDRGWSGVLLVPLEACDMVVKQIHLLFKLAIPPAFNISHTYDQLIIINNQLTYSRLNRILQTHQVQDVHPGLASTQESSN